MNKAEAIHAWLARYLELFGAVSGTVHFHVGDGLQLTAAVNIPPKVQDLLQKLAAGHGMAGSALERGVPVQKALTAGTFVALPVRDSAGKISAVVGVGFADERHLSPQELQRLEKAALTLTGLRWT